MNAVALCQATYDETRCRYEAMAPCMGSMACGFRILYGPPVQDAPFLFVGYQPGGTVGEASEHDGWPDTCEYATADWKLACRLRDVFGRSTLEGCTGLNAVFFRAPSVQAWRKVDAGVRHEAEAFSHERAGRIVVALRPCNIVVIGLGTLAMLGGGVAGVDVLHGVKQVLVRHGTIWGMPALGTVHLSGAWLGSADLDLLRDYFAGVVRATGPALP